jgi:cytochrome c oxidase accessory protein FixG
MSIENPLYEESEDRLFVSPEKIYPAAVKGVFRRIKWVILFGSLGIYYLLPFLRWNRGPGLPDQAVLLDFPHQRLYFFFVEIWPQDLYYITGLLILSAFSLFLVNSIAGRVWCGYLCPQTVWTDLFRVVERYFQGERREQMLRDEGPITFARIWRKAATYFAWLAIGLGTGGAWVLYFVDAPTLMRQLIAFDAPLLAYAWIGILTTTTFLLAGFYREQVCLWMCPWPRIQAALTDEWALNVSYRVDRGEPRGSLKHNDKLRAEGVKVGDCIDCGQCVAVCPTGVDIRQGTQMGCIQCGLCIDACDTVMTKVGKPTRLIAYDTDINIQRREAGQKPVFRLIRARTIIYVALIAITATTMGISYFNRKTIGVNVLHDRNPQYVVTTDDKIRNGYTIRLLNKESRAENLKLEVQGLPASAQVKALGATQGDGNSFEFSLDPDQTREARIFLIVPTADIRGQATSIRFHLTVADKNDGDSYDAADYFRAP